MDSDSAKTVLVCQNKTCRKQGAAKVLAAFEENAIASTTIQPSSCLGQCGNGPMVLVLPDEVWYERVRPDEVPAIVKRHLQEGNPIASMLYRKFHPQPR